MTSPYKTGTVTVTNGSTAVTGAGTGWTFALVEGGILVVDGVAAMVESVESDTALTLARAWGGQSVSGVAYSIARTTAEATRTIWANDRLAEIIRQMTITGLAPDGAGALAARPATPADGFVYAVIESGQSTYFSQYRSGAWVDGSPFKGTDGAPGARGASDGAPYLFDTSTTMADPGAGLLRLNHADPASATAIAFDDTSAASGNPSVAAWLSAMALSTNAVKGTLTLVARDIPSIFAVYHVSAVSADAGWKQVDVTHVDGAGAFTAAMPVQAIFSQAGDVGTRGASTGIPYTFDTSTAMADPGAGLLRLNHASPASATAIALDDTSAASGNPSVAAWLSAMALSTNAVKGTLTLVARDTPSIFAIYHVAAVSADAGWKQADVTYVDGAGAFTAGLACQVMFDRDGNAGVDGDVYATAADVATILGADSGFQSAVAAAAGAPNQQYVGAENVESKSYVPGGLKRLTGGANVGALQIKLPLTTATTGQWVIFWVDCYNYSPQASCSFLISAYIYVNAGSPTWVSPTVRQFGGDRRHPVTLGNDGTNRCIQIGDLTYNWGYPIFRVRDISGNLGPNWTTLTTTAWVLTVTASALSNIYQTIYDGSSSGVAEVGSSNDITSDLNALVKFGGFWNKLLETGASNLPVAGGWNVEYHRSSDTYGTQIAWPGYSNANAPYLRRMNGGTWSSWKALAWADDYVPKAGGTFTGAVSINTTLTVNGSIYAASVTNHLGYQANSGVGVYLGYNRSAAGQASIYLYADNAAPTTPSTSIARSAGTNAAFTITQTGTGGINFVPGSGGLKRDGYTILDINNRPDGTQALAQAGADTVQRTWKATDLKDAVTAHGPSAGTQALAQAGTDAVQRTWKATDLKDAVVAHGPPQGTQALALAGADASQRSWKATDLKDAARHWARVLPDFVAVTEAGATGDGSALETATIQAVIDSMSKGTVFLPPGSYLVDSLVLKEGVALRGAPGGSSILKANSNAINLLTMSASTGTKTHVDIADLKFNGNGKTNVTAVYLDGASSGNRISYVRLAKLHVIDCNEGLHLFYCANNTIDDCFVTGTAYGVHLDMCADSDVFKTKVQNGSAVGFYIVGGVGAYDEGVRLVGCSTNGQQVGLWVSGQDWGVASGCSFTTAAGGAGIFQSSTNWKLLGSEWAVAGGTPAAAGINIDASCSDFIVEGNEIALNTYGIIAAGTRHRIGGNNLKSNSNVDIYLNGATKCAIGGNICDSSTVAWSIREAGAANYNNAQGNTGNGLFTKVGTNSQFANNLTY